ncbi:pseudouridine synthase [Congregibacter variabilis]|uniref:Pseudouridine synthase n=1 Tax=Congregibacter variabilis TaxID=3081200 RepID=A0ABZ0I3I9_9GAMM|nr:pseudouridine synthase [Congregibacter sp. IMCC43200]
MADLILLNKPYQVLSQFTDDAGRDTLAKFVRTPGFYPAGRLDYDSEGLLLLCNDGRLQQRISDPRFKLWKTYWVQLEGQITMEAQLALKNGVLLKDGPTRPAKVKAIDQPPLWERNPPIRQRKQQATSWIEISINEGKNRQVRRMCAEVGFPVLRLVRTRIGDWALDGLLPGQHRRQSVHLPDKPPRPAEKRRSRRS